MANQINIYANSVGYGSRCSLWFGKAPFYVNDAGEAKRINSFKTKDWLYYPDALGKALLDNGIESKIYAHSGAIYVNGDLTGGFHNLPLRARLL